MGKFRIVISPENIFCYIAIYYIFRIFGKVVRETMSVSHATAGWNQTSDFNGWEKHATFNIWICHSEVTKVYQVIWDASTKMNKMSVTSKKTWFFKLIFGRASTAGNVKEVWKLFSIQNGSPLK